jgi:uncharacterized protein (UPF0548 family)
MIGTPSMQQRIAALSQVGFNFDPASLSESNGYSVTAERHPLPPEGSGDPTPGGPWEIARRLISNYEFADPATVRAHFDPSSPLLGRTMVLELRALEVFRVFVGVRIIAIIDETREVDGRQARVWGWTYGTLRGHVESGEMSWQTWKWLDTGEVEFRVDALSRPARIRNPFTAVGFRVVGPHERKAFLHSSGERMNRLIEEAAEAGQSSPDARQPIAGSG